MAGPTEPEAHGSRAGFLARFAPVQARGRVEQVDPPRTETVDLRGHQISQMATSGCLTAPFRAIGLLLGCLFAPFRFLLIPSLMSRGPQGPDQLGIPVNSFLLDGDDGRAYECVLRGELRGGALRLGDDIEVEGRFDSHGVLRVSTMVNLRTGASASGFVDPRARSGTARAVIALAVLVLVLVLLGQFAGAYR